MPKITVFMPVYNCEKYIKEAICSILTQSFKDFELLIINDGSTDSSLKIIESFKDKRIRIENNEKNMGLPYTRTKGLELAKGEYIALMDADDISYSNRLAEEFKYLEINKDVAFVSSFANLIIDNRVLNIKKNYIKKYLRKNEDLNLSIIFGNMVFNSSAMIRKSFINKYGIYYRSECFIAQDYAFWVDCLRYGKGYIMPKSLIAYRTGHENITKRSLNNKLINRKKIIDTVRERAIRDLGFNLNKDQLQKFNKVFSDPQINNSFYDLVEVNKILNYMVDCNLVNNLINNRKLIKNLKFQFNGRIIESKITIKQKLNLINNSTGYKYFKIDLISNIRLIIYLINGGI